jgi:glyoxylase-like metal-dependent hydrolase (beta-lactamase superfamily II)
MMKTLLFAAAALALGVSAGPLAAQQPLPNMQMWRIDCGSIEVSDLDVFSDSYLYVGQKKTLADSCYLIRHGENYLLWDAGLPGELAGKAPQVSGVFTSSLRARLIDQLARIGVKPDQVNFVGISHNHFDHIGQAADFPKATLLIGAEDFEASKKTDAAVRLGPWIKGGSKVQQTNGDLDVFGDGSVVILDMPGHTGGHQALLVRLPKTGPVLLTGDLFHFAENMRHRGVPGFNADRADTLASFDRFQAIAKNQKARIIIQHEPEDVSKLPAFPTPAE